MRRTFLLVGFLAFFGCNVDRLEPNQTATFLKFYGESNQTNATDLLVVDDGYVVIGTYSESASLILKTDQNGNKLWASSFGNFLAKSVTQVNDGYIIVGDGIDNANQSFMTLVKTSLEGDSLTSVSLGVASPSFGAGITFTSADEVVALGYGDFGNTYSSVVMMGYDQNLTPTWQSPRFYSVTGNNKIPYPSVYEKPPVNVPKGDLVWVDLSETQTAGYQLKASFVTPDFDGANAGPQLFNGETIGNISSDFIQMPVGYAVAQSIVVNNVNTIGISIFDQNVINEALMSDDERFLTGNYWPTSICTTPNGLLVAARTNKYEEANSTRTDFDLFLMEFGYDGKPKQSGIIGYFGGLGNEIPVCVRNANDGGYIVLGTLENTKGAFQIFLLKTNSKGKLN